MIKIVLNIQGEKLKQIFLDRNLNWCEVAENIGFSRNYFTTAFRRNEISKVAVNYLERNFNIPFDSYCVKEEPEAPEKPEKPEETISPEHAMELMEGIQDIKTQLEMVPKIRNKNEEDSLLTMTKSELVNAIYQAVYSAVIHANKNK